jgi:hypothetical protein
MHKVLIGLLGLCSIVVFIWVVNPGYDQQAREEQAAREANLAFLDSLTVIMNEQARIQEITLLKQEGSNFSGKW